MIEWLVPVYIFPWCDINPPSEVNFDILLWPGDILNFDIYGS